jgi:hypothetical protein
MSPSCGLVMADVLDELSITITLCLFTTLSYTALAEGYSVSVEELVKEVVLLD